MRFQRLLLTWFLLLAGVLLTDGQRASNLAARRKQHKNHCSHRRCMPLHSRVPFP
ncbi:apelin receptor early endogenous ligand [Elgaria multicarinata webbii]|uniref:apelin receptor early endogenous ligand n=1 Tax=Elgaria multicarinata webbii TaxID=159646 RepID=UPI002FCCD9AC